MLQHLDFKAIALGVMTNLAGSLLLALVLLSLVSVYLGQQGLDQQQIQKVLTTPTESLSLTLLILLVGSGADFASGYVTGKFAPHLELWHALIMMLIVLAVHFSLTDSARLGLGFALSQAVVGLVAALWGGGKAKRSKRG
ncbi:MAG: hypothetical protein KDD43_13355 [Bdellovibrionales bacterium]|nr:hypothetical protein [Bdellovibrionales bacterium]